MQLFRKRRSPLRALIALLLVPSLVAAQTAPAIATSGGGASAGSAAAAPTPRAPAPAPVSTSPGVATGVAKAGVSNLPPGMPIPPHLKPEFQLLERQVARFQKHWSVAEQTLPKVYNTAQKLDALPDQFPARVAAFKTRYGIPEHATLGQEARGAARWIMDKARVSPARQESVLKAFDQAGRNARSFKPLSPINIGIAVAAVAGFNIFGQLANGEGIDAKKTFGFLGDSSFWGGVVGSGMAYSLSALVLTSVLPPGGGLVRAVLPTLGSMVAAIVGGHVGAERFDWKKALAKLDMGEVLGQAAGSTLGLFMGSQIGVLLGGMLGSAAGPVGMIAGTIILGQVGAMVGRGISRLFKGETKPLEQAFDKVGEVLRGVEGLEAAAGQQVLASELGVNASLPGAQFIRTPEANKIKAAYNDAYARFLDAARSGDRKGAAKLYGELTTRKRQYEIVVRTVFRDTARRQGTVTAIPAR